MDRGRQRHQRQVGVANERAVREGAADIGLARFRPLPPDVQSRFLYEDALLLIAAHDGLDLEREPPDAADLLARLPLFTYGPAATWIAVEEALRRASDKFERRFRRMERLAGGDGRVPAALGAEAWDVLWRRAKASD